ncbi:MAG: hypothetical protein EA343_16865 [Nodularia sp. (in: Bacteria)]|nr:MAG: hypothetical protein EA343_16865 [Nodularia sp. (in: cyanobacteria)]
MWFTLIIGKSLKILFKITAIAGGGALPIAIYRAKHFVTNLFNLILYDYQLIITIDNSQIYFI